jgi:class 3 adenylate cyclase
MFAPAQCSPADASSPGMSAIEPPYTHGMPVNNSANAVPYLARIIQEHLVADPDGRAWSRDGTAALLDISGFTMLSEQLARKGREGAEQITEIIGRSFESILKVAYENGASLLKFGGDALLLWFPGRRPRRTRRSCRRPDARSLARCRNHRRPGAKVTLQMSQGLHSGHFHFFAVGSSHLELLPVGPAWSRAVAMERVAQADEILISPETAALLAKECLGEARSPGVLLASAPGEGEKRPIVPRPQMAPELILRCLSPAIRAHVGGGGWGVRASPGHDRVHPLRRGRTR